MSKKNKKQEKKSENSSIAQPASQPFPDLGHQLCTTPCTKPDFDGWIKITPTPAQRIRTFFSAFATGLILATIFILFIYLPDIVADYGHRSENFLHFLTGYLLVGVGLIGIASAVSALLRDTVCHIHPQKRLILFSSSINQNKIKQAVSIDDLPMLEMIPTGIIFKRSRIFTAEGNMQKPIAETAGDETDIQALFHWMKEN